MYYRERKSSCPKSPATRDHRRIRQRILQYTAKPYNAIVTRVGEDVGNIYIYYVFLQLYA